jgi:hypothetical protein
MIAALAALALGDAVASCGAVPGSEALFAAGRPRIVWVGEGHGTKEQPKVFASLACLAGRTGRQVVIALERGTDEQPYWDAFLASDGGPAARAALLKAQSWTGNIQDGRSSKAMLALAEQLRREHTAWRVQGVRLIISVDNWPASGMSPGLYEARMGQAVDAIASAHPDAWVLVFSGNLHASKGENTRAPTPYRLAASTLKPEEVTSVLIATDGGPSWGCQEVCGPHDSPPRPHHQRGFEAGAPFPKFDYTIYLGAKTHVSPPAGRAATIEKVPVSALMR